MDSIIREMYFGDALPFWEQSIKTKEYIEKINELLELQKKFLEEHPEAAEFLDKYSYLSSEVSTEDNYRQFLLGFKTGARVMSEILKS